MTHILYLTYDGLTDHLGRSQIIPYLNALHNNAYQVHVVSADKVDRYQLNKERVEKQLCDGINWTSIQYTKSPPVLSTLLDLKRMRKKALHLFRKFPIGIVHVRSYPPMDIALKLKRKFGIKVIFDMRGFYPEERLEGGIWKISNPIHRLLFSQLKRKETEYLKSSDHIISLTEVAKQILVESHHVDQSIVSVIPCCAEFDHFQIIDKNRDNEFMNLVYLGSLGTWYLIPEMLRLFKRISDIYRNARLTIFTGDEASEALSLCTEMGIDESKIRIESVDRDKLPTELSKFDISLFLIKPSYSKQASSPTKLAELLACGIPVLCNEEVGDIKFLTEHLSGIKSFPISQLEHMDIQSTVEDLMDIDRMKIRTKAQETLDITVAEKAYLHVYRLLSD